MNDRNQLEQKNRELEKQLSSAQAEIEQNQLILQKISDFSSRLGVTVEIKETYRNCLQLFKELIDLDYASLFIKDAAQETMMMCETIGFPSSMPNHFTIRKGVGLPGLILQTKKIELVEDFTTETRIRIPEIIKQENIRSAIAVPMFHNNSLFGAIVGHCKQKVVFSEDQKKICTIFANQSATAIKNAIHIQSLKLSDRALLERSNELHSIFENSVAGIMLLKGDRIIARCNQQLADIMGYETPEEMVGISMRLLHLSEERYQKIGKSVNKTLYAGRQVREEYQLRRKNGSSIWCEISGKALDKNIPPDLTKGIVYIIQDISQRKKMEEQLLKGQKLESLAILTGGLGHDFNNIITAILGNIDLCLATTDPGHKSYPFLEPAKEATLRAKDLTERLQVLSRPSKPVLRPASLPQIIEEVASTTIPQTIQLINDFAANLREAEIDSNQISRVFEHLFANSIQAMGDEGKILINCTNYTNNGEITGLRRGYFIRVSLHDTGHGIAPEIFDKIFDPYFTTRGRSKEKGSGLGLTTVLSIIKRHKGVIAADSNIDEGATFTFYLPAIRIVEESRKEQSNAKQKDSATTGKGKILLMDDDESIRLITQQMLRFVGYIVESTENGERTLEQYKSAQESGSPFDLVIMDLNILDGMGAVETIAKLLQFDKNAKVIVASGDAMDPVMCKYKDYGFHTALAKPYEFATLHKVLAKALFS